MKMIPRLLPACLVLLALSGCLQIDTLITVRADGSGTVRETVRLSEETVEMVRQMEQMAQEAGGQASSDGFIDRAELERRATAMGPGVRFESVEEIPGSGGYGYEAVWAFDDVNTLRVEQNAENAVPQPGMEPAAAEESDNPAATFRLEPGSPAVLHVTSTLAGGESSPADPAAPAGDEQVPPEMLREMFAGMRFSIAVEVEGAIVETNASHHDGSRVTLFELDFDQLLQDPKAIALMAATDEPDPMKLKDALRGIPGIKVETETDLKVAFVAPGADTPTLAAAVGAAASEVAADAAATVEAATASAADVAQQATAAVSEVAAESVAAVAAVMPSAPEPVAPTVSEAAVAAVPAEAASGAAAAPTTQPAAESASMAESTMPAVPATAASSAEMPTTTAMASPTPLGTIAGYSWRAIALADLAEQRFKLVALTDASGSVTKGMVMAIDAGSVTLRRASMDGGGTIAVPLATLRAASVFEQGS